MTSRIRISNFILSTDASLEVAKKVLEDFGQNRENKKNLKVFEKIFPMRFVEEIVDSKANFYHFEFENVNKGSDNAWRIDQKDISFHFSGLTSIGPVFDLKDKRLLHPTKEYLMEQLELLCEEDKVLKKEIEDLKQAQANVLPQPEVKQDIVFPEKRVLPKLEVEQEMISTSKDRYIFEEPSQDIFEQAEENPREQEKQRELNNQEQDRKEQEEQRELNSQDKEAPLDKKIKKVQYKRGKQKVAVAAAKRRTMREKEAKRLAGSKEIEAMKLPGSKKARDELLKTKVVAKVTELGYKDYSDGGLTKSTKLVIIQEAYNQLKLDDPSAPGRIKASLDKAGESS
jgi:hypothetical protein